jgi:hypothetical protein
MLPHVRNAVPPVLRTVAFARKFLMNYGFAGVGFGGFSNGSKDLSKRRMARRGPCLICFTLAVFTLIDCLFMSTLFNAKSGWKKIWFKPCDANCFRWLDSADYL